MKINELTEMTMRGPDLSKSAQTFVDANKRRWATHGKYIADIENYKVLLDGIYYTLWDNDVLVAAASLSNATNEVDDVWVNPDYRSRKIFSMMLWFFKTRLNKDKILLGQIHSKDMQEVVKGLSRFEKKWYNIRTNAVEPFSVDTVDNYYSHGGPTPWRLMLENDGDFNWPMFNQGGFMKEAYEVYVD